MSTAAYLQVAASLYRLDLASAWSSMKTPSGRLEEMNRGDGGLYLRHD